MSGVIQPGARIGVLGSGQLGRMFTIAARRLGYRVHVLSPDDDTPAGQVADVEINAAYTDLTAIAEFAKNVDVVTFEFENVPVEAIHVVDRYVPVRPGGRVLHTTQHRLREKTFLQSAGLPVTPFQPIHSRDDLRRHAAENLPAVLKTAAWGYDGKGQVRIDKGSDLDTSWSVLNTDAAILEQFIDFQCELSVVAARSDRGDVVHYSAIRNTHRHHILDLSVTPCQLPPGVEAQAVEIAHIVLQQLEVVGVLCVEFFLARNGNLYVNELAPRPHNSGHLTIDAHATCQFEQQVRAVCGLPLGAPTRFRAAAMANLMGEGWQSGTPPWDQALAFEDVKLHLYGKREPRQGRKMGHLTALADTANVAEQRVLAARNALFGG